MQTERSHQGTILLDGNDCSAIDIFIPSTFKVELVIMKPVSLRSGILFIICISIPLIIGMIGSVFTVSSIPVWYAALVKPSFNPPSWVFGPAWTILYCLMGIALYLVVKDGIQDPIKKTGLVFFTIQLILNLLWSIVFFGMHEIFYAFVTILVLFVFIAATMVSFFRLSKPAGWLFIPYLCWVAFASILNATIWILN